MTFLLISFLVGVLLLTLARTGDKRTTGLIGSRSYDKVYGGAPGARAADR